MSALTKIYNRTLEVAVVSLQPLSKESRRGGNPADSKSIISSLTQVKA